MKKIMKVLLWILIFSFIVQVIYSIKILNLNAAMGWLAASMMSVCLMGVDRNLDLAIYIIKEINKRKKL